VTLNAAAIDAGQADGDRDETSPGTVAFPGRARILDSAALQVNDLCFQPAARKLAGLARPEEWPDRVGRDYSTETTSVSEMRDLPTTSSARPLSNETSLTSPLTREDEATG
jgi:hypothetical protein